MKIIAQKKFRVITMRLRSDGIMNNIIHNNLLIKIEDLKEVMIWVESLGNAKYLNLFEGGYNTDFDPLVRDFASSSEGNKYTIADAIVVITPAQQLIANFYIQFNKPHMPTKVFDDRDKAIEWLLSHK